MILLLLFVVISASLCYCWMKIIKNGSGHVISGCFPIIGLTYQVIGDTEIITDPEDITTAGNLCLQKHFAFDFAKPWLGDGLITGTTSVWKRHRKLLNPAFTLQVLHGFLDVFNEQARELVDNLIVEVDKGPINISSYFRENAMKTLCQTALGINGREKVSLFQNYVEAADQILELIVWRFQNFWLQSDLIYKLVGLKKKETDLIKVLNNMSDAVIKEKRLKMNVSGGQDKAQKPGLKYNAFLDLLLELSEDSTLTDKEIREEVDSIIVAGTDTSAWLLTYTCAVLGTYPEVQEKVVNELTQVFGDSDRDVDKNDLQKLVYTEAVIKETLRLYPVAAVSLRTVETGVKLKNHYLRPGDHIIMSFYGVNRHPVWGPDADQFRPERWLGTDTLPTVYGGFGIGKRGCIGKTFAMMSMKTLLAHVLRRYHVSGDITKLKLKLDFIVKPICGHLVSLSNRNCRLEKIRKQA